MEFSRNIASAKYQDALNTWDDFECLIKYDFREWTSSVQYAAIVTEVECFEIAVWFKHV